MRMCDLFVFGCFGKQEAGSRKQELLPTSIDR